MPKQLGIRILRESELVYFPGNYKKDPGGWTGITLVNESHVSIHTSSKRGFLTADIYLCKNGMDKESIINFFKETFALKDVEINFVKCGTRYQNKNIY